MSGDSGDKRSSPFDRMLDENRRQFDALLTRRAPAARPEPRPEPARPSAPKDIPTPPAAKAPESKPAGEPFDIRTTDIGQTLARRYGENWRFEIVDKRRDGEDVVVWARLTAGEHDKTRRGRARIEGARAPTAVSGNAGGTAFVLKAATATDRAGTDHAAAEAAATHAAVRQALAACAKGL